MSTNNETGRVFPAPVLDLGRYTFESPFPMRILRDQPNMDWVLQDSMGRVLAYTENRNDQPIFPITKGYRYVRAQAAAGILCIDKNDNVLLLKQLRGPKKDKLTVEMPGGSLEAGETRRAGAVRELFEETGMVVTDEELDLGEQFDLEIDHTAVEHSVSGLVARVDHFPDDLHEGAFVVPLKDALEMVRNREITHIFTVLMLISLRK